MDISQTTPRRIFQIAFFASLLISAYLIWQDDIMNANGYLYLRSAQLFLDDGFFASYSGVGWPFYSITIATISRLTTLPLDYSALLINSLFFAVLTVTIGKIITELTNDRRILCIAILLLLAHPKLNDSYRTYIIRDAGYWALYFASILAFLRFWKDPRLIYAAAWCGAIIFATLFRNEGAVSLLAAPFILFFHQEISFKQRLKRFGAINLVPFSLAIFVLIIGGAAGLLELKYLGKLAQLHIWATDIIPSLHTELLDRAARLNESVFYVYTYSHSHAVSGIITILALIFLTEIASSLSYLYTPFSLHAIARGIYPKNSGVSIIAGFMVINAIICLTFLFKYYFLTGRYGMTLAFLLLILSSFSLTNLYDRWQHQRQISWKWRWSGRIFAFIFLLTTLDGFISTSPSKEYVRQAGDWLRTNIPETAEVYTNNPGLLYYSGRVSKDLNIYRATTENIKDILNRDGSEVYIAFNIRKKHNEQIKWLSSWDGAAPVMEFKNEDSDKIVIFSNSNQHRSLKAQP